METLKELLAIGKQYFENKQYAQAESYLRRVLDNNGRYADVLNMLGVIAHIEGRFANAIELFREALEINPRYTEATLNLAVLHNDLGQYAEAKKLYSKLRGNKGHSSAQIEPVLRGKLSNLHADIGDIYRSIGLYQFAIEEYHKALNLNPGYFDIRTKLGQALREKGSLPESLKELKNVLSSDGRYSPALIQMGITYYSMGKITDANRCWKEVLNANPDHEHAKMYLRLCESVAEKGTLPKMAATEKAPAKAKETKSKAKKTPAKKSK